MTIGYDALQPGQRELLRWLARGQRIEEVADARETSIEQVEADAREALVALDPALAALVAPDDRRLVAAHLLLRSDQHVAVAEVLARSPDARRWVLWLGEALHVIAPDARPTQTPDVGATAVEQVRHEAGEVNGDASNRPAQGPGTAATTDSAHTGGTTADATDAEVAPRSRRDHALLAATVVTGFVLLTLGIALA